MKKVLFVCIHNSARSQMAEAYLNHFGKGKFEAKSAGLEKGSLNPFVIRAMMEDGIDISANKTKTVDEMLMEKNSFDYVITVCDEISAERCPYFPGGGQRFHWGFPDPSAFSGNDEKRMAQIRNVRDQIKTKIRAFAGE
ncbi:MAG TPA: arsenate reductase ArsC [Bacteroidia bacterium]|nr:arsenate reductase ArsC [Bacteroidia bacterium]